VYVFMYMTYKFYLGRVLSVGGSKLECLAKKGFESRSFYSGLKSVRLSEPQANVPSSFLDAVRLSEA